MKHLSFFLLLMVCFLNVKCDDAPPLDALNFSNIKPATQEPVVSQSQLQGQFQQILFNAPLHLAVANNQINEVISLIQQNLDINKKTSEGYTALHIAAQLDFQEIAQTLIEQGAHVNVKDNLGNTPLHYAAQQNSFNVASVLMENEGDSSSKNNNNETPLDITARLGHAATLQVLL